VALTLAGFATAVPAAQAGWSKPFEFTKPGSLDLIPTQIAFAPGGASAAGFGVQDVDTPGVSQAYVTTRSAGGAVGRPRAIGSARQILALSFDGSALELLTASSPGGETCCSAAQAVRLTASGTLAPPRTLVGGLAGAADGQLLTLGDGAMLAAVATERGVWVVQSASGNRFGAQHLLTGRGQMPTALAAAWLGGQNTIVAWTAATGIAGAADPRTIYYATGSKSGPPRRVQKLLTVAAGHRIDELGVARRGSGATAAWVESWYDQRGNFHSEVDATDIAADPRVRLLSAPDPPASGLTIAADAAGDQAVSWKSCRQNGSCTVQAAVRGPTTRFGAAQSLGRIDPSQTPAVAVGSRGQTILGWVRYGQPVASVGSAGGGPFGTGPFGPMRTLSRSTFAYDLTVGFSPARGGLAAWSQGTLNPSVVGAAYNG
jgi:hypothetical protein